MTEATFRWRSGSLCDGGSPSGAADRWPFPARFPPTTMRYRIRYSLYSIEADNPLTAKLKAVKLLRESTEQLIYVEKYEDRKPLWRLFLGG
jgi:hypothetical protein